MNRILCPVDFSEASLTALEFATRIGERHGSSLKLIHVITPGEYNQVLSIEDGDEYEVLKKGIKSKLQVLCTEINDASKSDYEICTCEVLSGDLTDKVVEISESENISMIVMGTEGIKDMQEARMGSNTVNVITNSRIPVLAVPAGIQYHNFKRIVYGSELGDDDKLFLQQIINFAVPFDSRINIVHVSESSAGAKSEYDKYVDNVKSYFTYPKLRIEEFETTESISTALEHTMNVHDAHLLVLVHKSRNKLENLFHISLTRKMSYLTNFPLLALRN